MKFSKLLKFIEEEHSRLKTFYKQENEKQLLARTVKLTEEVGELSDEILTSLNKQRGDKLKENNKELQGEFADVVITTLLLAREADVDIKKALSQKIKEIRKREYQR